MNKALGKTPGVFFNKLPIKYCLEQLLCYLIGGTSD